MVFSVAGFRWDGFSLAVNFEGNGALMVAVFVVAGCCYCNGVGRG